MRLRTAKTKGCGSRQATLTLVFKLAHAAQKRWRRLNGHPLLNDVLAGITFTNAIKPLAA